MQNPLEHKPNPGRGWWSRLCPVTKHDLDKAKAEILAAIAKRQNDEMDALAKRLNESSDSLDAAVKANTPGTTES